MHMIKKIWNFITTAALVIMLMLVAILYIPKFLGISPLIVLSGSMEPVYPTGSLLYVNQHNLDNIQIGDAITFYIDENTLVTHRVVEIDEISCTYITKGDANEVNDGNPVSFDDVLGVPIINIPKLGIFADWLSHKSGKIIYVTVIIVVTILMFMGDIIWSDDNEKENENDKEEQY